MLNISNEVEQNMMIKFEILKIIFFNDSENNSYDTQTIVL